MSLLCTSCRLFQQSNRLFSVHFAIWLFVTCAYLGWIGSPAASAQEAAAAFRFIPDDAVAAVVAYPRKLLTQKEMEMFPLEVITAMGLKELGFDPLEVEQIVAFAQMPSDGPIPGYGAVIKFSKPYDRENVLPMLMAGTTPDTIAGKPYQRSESPVMPSVMFPNDKTIVLAAAPTLEKMLAGSKGNGPLVKQLRELKGTHHLSVVLAMDPVRDLLNAQLDGAPPLPEPFEGLKTLPNKVSSVEAHLDISKSFKLQLALRSPTAGAAGEVERQLGEALEAGKQMFLAEAQQKLTSDDPVEQASARYSERMANHYAASLRPKLDGDRVVLSIDADPGMATTGVLVGLLLPAVQGARQAAQRAQASNNLKQIAIAMHNYHDIWGRFPAAAKYSKEGKPLLSWRVLLLPYVDGNNLYDQFHLDEPWDSDHNKQLIDKMPDVYRSPSRKERDYLTRYQVPVGPGTLFEGQEGKRLADITDGSSNTVMVVETNDEAAVVWTQPEDWHLNAEDPLKGLTGQTKEQFQVSLADGSVRVLKDLLDPAQWKAMLTRAGGEIVQFPQ